MIIFKDDKGFDDFFVIFCLFLLLILNIFCLTLFKSRVHENKILYNRIKLEISNREELMKILEINDTVMILKSEILMPYEQKLSLESINPSDFSSEKELLNYLKSNV